MTSTRVMCGAGDRAAGVVPMSWWGWLLIGAGLLVASWMLLVFLAARLPEGSLKELAAFLPDCATTARRLRGDDRVPAPSKDRGRVRSVVGVVADRSDSGVPAGDRPAGRCRGCRPRLPLRRAPGSTGGAARGVAGQTVHYRTAPRSSTPRRHRPEPHSHVAVRGWLVHWGDGDHGLRGVCGVVHDGHVRPRGPWTRLHSRFRASGVCCRASTGSCPGRGRSVWWS